eukprot:CAMPEP_0201884300 /NCGR_PEP_ID=MMETSP0902-20130614/16896_1 /ASSEMBLY_ACC=CAM_ASM_000551 /TAXON_ID=420261 /ORGANISM="Thalassiosira antarctica, Strain CCMP982" /LENGTH=205 /DNA_ID=CAMNT_0048413239 /DNA_START=71 /DNA_END=685 /DNA_ORIENTATION=-
MNILTQTLVVMAIANAMMVHGRVAFITPSQPKAKIISPITQSLTNPSILTTGRYHTSHTTSCKHHVPQRQQTTTSLQMNFSLPPSGPSEPKGPLDDIKALLPTIGTGVLVALFFASPLGGFFFSVVNSLFVLALLTPFVLFGGFQIWTSLYTVEAPCPSCGVSPVRVLKDGKEPGVCLNCGAFSRANEKGDGLELCNNPYAGEMG